jgi:TolB-like protein/DNA-binding winged helix-turn-helix (wHTH) protein/Tfp pilus assembly protein PilF
VLDTLLCLIDRAGELVDKETLMSVVWPRIVVEENNLDQNISTLRQIFGERRGENRYVETVRGRGYRFVAPVTQCDSPALSAPTVASSATVTSIVRVGNPQASAVTRRVLQGTWSLYALAAAGLMLALGGALLVSSRDDNARAVPQPTLAVLPFKPLAATDRNESLELGMAETLIRGLNGPTLRVLPLSSVRRYTSLEQNAVLAGRELQVASVLEGHIQRDGTQLRVSARLLRVTDGLQLWADRYDESFTDIFSVQDAIAAKVRAALAPELGTSPAPAFRRGTRDAEAYQHYADGQFFLNRRDEASLRGAIAAFRQAVERDPQFALAYVGLAEAHAILGIFGVVAPHETFPDAQRAVEKALELDPGLGEAYASLGHIKLQYEHDWRGAERALRRAVELAPEYPRSHQWLGLYLALAGRFEEGVAHAREAQALEPLAPTYGAFLGLLLIYQRRYAEAIEQLEGILARDPRLANARSYLAVAHLRRGELEKALDLLSGLDELAPGSMGYVGQIHALAGRREAALEEIDRLIELSRERYVPAYDIATIYAALGDRDQTFEWLERAFEDRSTLVVWLRWEPIFDDMRADPRYAPLAARLELE